MAGRCGFKFVYFVCLAALIFTVPSVQTDNEADKEDKSVSLVEQTGKDVESQPDMLHFSDDVSTDAMIYSSWPYTFLGKLPWAT